jgi:hypothetical protein
VLAVAVVVASVAAAVDRPQLLVLVVEVAAVVEAHW